MLSTPSKICDDTKYYLKYWFYDGRLFYKSCLPKVTGDMNFYARYESITTNQDKPILNKNKNQNKSESKSYFYKIDRNDNLINGAMFDKFYYIVCVE